MKASQVVRESVRSVLRRPPLIALEIAWRWTLGTACGLLLWVIVHSGARRISGADVQELRTLNPDFVSAAMLHILTQNGRYFLFLAAILVLGLALLWTLFAGAGRALTLTLITGRRGRVFNVVLAQAFRAGVTIMSVLLFFGLLFAAARLSVTREGELHVALYGLLVLIDIAVSALLWATGNWIFWLASIAAGVHDRFFGPKPSIFSEARRLARDQQHLDLEIAFGMPRTALFVVVFIVSLIPTVMLLRGGGTALSVLLSLLTLAYLAAADVLQIARVAAILRLVTAAQDARQNAAPASS